MTLKKKRVIAVAGCKGGVGKTFVSVNLALSLSKLGQRVVLMDGNLSVPDIGPALGLDNSIGTGGKDISTQSWEGQILRGPSGITVLTPANGSIWRQSIEINDTITLISKLEGLASSLDTLIIDTAPGMAPDNITLIQAAGEILIIVNQDVLSLLDAARLIRLLNRVYECRRFGIVVNAVGSKKTGSEQFERLQYYLNYDNEMVLNYLGSIPFDKAVLGALNQQQALLDVNPDCRASRAFQRLAHKLSVIPVPKPRGSIEIFMPTKLKEGA
ncbi:MAG: P-loop NTPase [Candidatus Endonucleobacter sp. (ex Gigantidas childressi)]|nr:P-loop NTPase [Candidatus Endonucleobacter sp. (ex Gigantidas childressi)]